MKTNACLLAVLWSLWPGGVACFPAAAQTPGFSIPRLGLVVDADAHNVYPMTGIPGAALVGERLALPFAFSRALATRSPLWLLVLPPEDDGGGGPPAIAWLDSRATAQQSLDGLSASPDRIALSPAASAALFVYSQSRQLIVASGLPDTPSVRRVDASSWDLASGLFAVSDDGRRILAAVPEQGLVWISGETADRIPFPDPVRHIAFAPGSGNAVWASDSGLYALDGSLPRRIAALNPAAGPVVGLAVSADGRTAFLSHASGLVQYLDTVTGAGNHIQCACQPTGMVPISRDGLFRLNDFHGGPIFLLDATASQPRVWFVPVDPQSPLQAQAQEDNGQ